MKLSYFFDILSLKEVHYLKSKDTELLQEIDSISKEIIDKIGNKLFADIVNSKEYQRLFDSHLKIIEVSEMAIDPGCAGNIVVYSYLQKEKDIISLQKKFFPLE